MRLAEVKTLLLSLNENIHVDDRQTIDTNVGYISCFKRLKNESFCKTISPYNASLQFRDPDYSYSQGAISYLEKRRFDTTPCNWCKLEFSQLQIHKSYKSWRWTEETIVIGYAIFDKFLVSFKARSFSLQQHGQNFRNSFWFREILPNCPLADPIPPPNRHFLPRASLN